MAENLELKVGQVYEVLMDNDKEKTKGIYLGKKLVVEWTGRTGGEKVYRNIFVYHTHKEPAFRIFTDGMITNGALRVSSPERYFENESEREYVERRLNAAGLTKPAKRLEETTNA